MTFVMKKIADYGASHPVVARLSVQACNIIQFFSLDKSQADDLKEIYMMRVQPRVLDCTEVARRIAGEVERIKNEILTQGVRSQSEWRVVQLPQVMRLRE